MSHFSNLFHPLPSQPPSNISFQGAQKDNDWGSKEKIESLEVQETAMVAESNIKRPCGNEYCDVLEVPSKLYYCESKNCRKQYCYECVHICYDCCRFYCEEHLNKECPHRLQKYENLK
jgi:hypothetical protein